MFYLFKRFTFCFRHQLPYKEQLQYHHDGKKQKGITPTHLFGQVRKRKCNDGSHHPMRGAAKRLAFSPYLRWKDL